MLRRREFLAFAQLPVWAEAAADNRIGLAIGTYGMKSIPTRDALGAIADIGYDGVALALMPGWPADPARLTALDRKILAQAIRDSGLRIPALNESLPLLGTAENRAYNLDRLRLAAEMAHVVNPAAPPCLDTILGLKTEDWDQVAPRMLDELHSWARVAERESLTIGLKPHAGQAVDTPHKALWLIQNLRSPRMRLIYDYSHMRVGGFGLRESLTQLLPYTVFISLKDSQGAPEHYEFLLPGEGATDYEAYLRLLKQLHYRGFVSVEVSSMVQQKAGYDPIAAARLCYNKLAAAFAKAGVQRPPHQ